MKQLLIGLGIGIVTGGIVGYFLAKKNGEAEVQKEIEEAREQYVKKIASIYDRQDKDNPEKPKKGAPVEMPKPIDYTKFASKPRATVEKPSLDDLVSGLPAKDEIGIVSETYNLENPDDFEQTTLVYYTEDDVLVDEQEEPISDRETLIGDFSLVQMAAEEPEEHIVYFRNPKMKTIFEVVFAEMSYAREVLGVPSEEEMTME